MSRWVFNPEDRLINLDHFASIQIEGIRNDPGWLLVAHTASEKHCEVLATSDDYDELYAMMQRIANFRLDTAS